MPTEEEHSRRCSRRRRRSRWGNQLQSSRARLWCPSRACPRSRYLQSLALPACRVRHPCARPLAPLTAATAAAPLSGRHQLVVRSCATLTTTILVWQAERPSSSSVRGAWPSCRSPVATAQGERQRTSIFASSRGALVARLGVATRKCVRRARLALHAAVNFARKRATAEARFALSCFVF